jgi:hypothetical protein
MGTPNKRTAALRAAIADLLGPGSDPRTFFAAILRNAGAPLELRFAAAKALAPFMHPKLSSIEARTGGKTHEDRLREAQRLLSDDGDGRQDDEMRMGGVVEMKMKGVGWMGPPRHKH